MGQQLIDAATRMAHALAQHTASKEVFWSLALIGSAALAGQIQFRRIRDKHDMGWEQKRQARANFRNAMILATLAALGFVWGGEIRALIISVAAIMAAVMIVSKELISCVYGAIVFTLSKSAKIGDAIEIGAYKGELVDHNWFSMSLMELSDSHFYSGKVVKIPNSLLLTAPLINFSQGGDYRFCMLVFHARQESASAALDCALAAAEDCCSEWMEAARASMAALRDERLAQTPDVEPKASLASVDKDSLAVHLRFVVPGAKRASVQAEVSRRYFERFEAHLRSERALAAQPPGPEEPPARPPPAPEPLAAPSAFSAMSLGSAAAPLAVAPGASR